MNIAQAKAIAGIAPQVQTVGAKGAEYALAQVKRRMVEARRSSLGEDHPDLRKLSEAKAFFRQMFNRFCPVCRVPIAKGAKACALHARRPTAKALPLPAGFDLPQTKKSSRVDVAPAGGPLASVGYYAPAIQKAIRKWQPTIGEKWLQYYFRELVKVAKGWSTKLDLCFVPPAYLPAVCEIGSAVSKLYRDTSKPAAWLLKLPISVAMNGCFPSWGDIRKQIKKEGGRWFTVAELKNTAKRLKMLTPAVMAKEWRQFCRIKNAP